MKVEGLFIFNFKQKNVKQDKLPKYTISQAFSLKEKKIESSLNRDIDRKKEKINGSSHEGNMDKEETVYILNLQLHQYEITIVEKV